MKPGDLVLVSLPVRGSGPWKLRPALFLATCRAHIKRSCYAA